MKVQNGLIMLAALLVLVGPSRSQPVEIDLVWPSGVCVADDTVLYIADRARNRVWMVDLVSYEATVLLGDLPDGGQGTELSAPEALALTGDGELLIADRGNARVLSLDIVSGRHKIIAGTGVSGYSGEGGPAASAELSAPYGITVDEHGNVYISDTENHRIRRVDTETSQISTIAGTGERGFGGDKGRATEALLSRPHPILMTPGGLVIADSFNNRLRMIDIETGIISTIAGTGKRGVSGNGGLATDADFLFFGGLALDPKGRIVVTGWGSNDIRRIDLVAGTVELVTGGDQSEITDPHGVAVDSNGNIYYADSGTSTVRRIDAKTGDITIIVAPAN